MPTQNLQLNNFNFSKLHTIGEMLGVSIENEYSYCINLAKLLAKRLSYQPKSLKDLLKHMVVWSQSSPENLKIALDKNKGNPIDHAKEIEMYFGKLQRLQIEREEAAKRRKEKQRLADIKAQEGNIKRVAALKKYEKKKAKEKAKPITKKIIIDDTAFKLSVAKPERRVRPKIDLTNKDRLDDYYYVMSSDFLKSYEWRKLRMQVLVHYGNTCMCCGASPQPDNPVNVDHIKCRARFPKLALTFNNLQVLCNVCNHGKGNWNEKDWRPKNKIPTKAVAS